MIEIIQAVAGIMSTLVAVAALYLAFRYERRNHLRFEDQLKQSKEIASANVMPLLTIHSQTYVDSKGISLVNGGIGTAVITDIEFIKEGRTTRSLVDLFDLGPDFMWNSFWRFSGSKYYLRAGKKYQLVKLTVKNLVSQGWSEEEAKELLLGWQEQKTGIRIRIEYSNVLDNSMEPYCETLK